MSLNHEDTTKTVTADLTTNHDAVTNTSHAEKLTRLVKTANKSSKVAQASSVKYPVSVIDFYWVQLL